VKEEGLKCQECETYKATKGRGSKKCLHCDQYKQFNQENSDRPSIKFVKVPDEILENVADLNSDMPDIIAALRTMDPRQSILISAQYTLGLSQREIAEIFNCSPAQINKKLSESIEHLKKIITE